MEYLYYICDVFTDTRFGGNQLAVLPDARGLTDKQMQQIAREFNFAETTFVLPPEQQGTKKVRIFTPSSELAFAGHPNLGTAYVLAMTDPQLQASTSLVFEELAGLVEVSISRTGNKLYCELRAPQPLIIGDVVPLNLVAEALGLPPSCILTRRHQPRACSVGLPVIFAELDSEDSLSRIQISQKPFRTLKNQHHSNLLHTYVAGEGNTFNTRVFAPLLGVGEDSATGSANCAFGGLIAACDDYSSGDFSITVTQGIAMGRPSLLSPRARKKDGQVIDTWIGGNAVMFSQGTLFVD